MKAGTSSISERHLGRVSVLVLAAFLGISAVLGALAPSAVAASGPTVTSSATVVKGANNCNPAYYSSSTSFTCSLSLSVTSGDLVAVAFQVAYYSGIPYTSLTLADSAGTSFSQTAVCGSGCYTISVSFQTGIYYGIAQSSSSSDTITLTSQGSYGYPAGQSVASLTLEAYDVSFAGISGTPGLSSNAVYNCKYQDYNNLNNCSGSSIPMTQPQVTPLSVSTGAFVLGAVLTTGPSVSGGSGFTFVSTKCLNNNYCYGAEYATSDSVTSPTNVLFSAGSPGYVYWGWAESAAVFSASSGFRSAPPPSLTQGNETITPVEIQGSTGYDLWVPIATAVVGLAVGFAIAFGFAQMRKPQPPKQ